MSAYQDLFTAEERAAFALRRLYSDHGFRPYRMSKFEEYDLYAKNKDFLVSPQVITFTDTDGRLMALKPDVTLSIVKNFDRSDAPLRVYYDENVYRPTQNGGFREILQSGVECIGTLTRSDVREVLSLAAQSLSAISSDFVLSVSDFGVSEGLFRAMDASEELQEALLDAIRRKNATEAARLCAQSGVSEEAVGALVACITVSEPLASALEKLRPLALNETMASAFEKLTDFGESDKLAVHRDSLVFDLSVLPNRRFYDGVVFAGYVAGVPSAVLSGGCYGKLMRRMKKEGEAIGFAVYLDRLADLDRLGGAR